MRLAKTFFAAVIGVSLVATPSAAQRTAPFGDSWFWGLKGGVNTFNTGINGSASVPSWGLDWLITRDRGGLYVSGDQSFFSRTVTQSDVASPNGRRDVVIKNMNRVGFAMVAFPGKVGIWNPYGGAGAAISVLGQATPQPDSSNGVAGQQFLSDTDKARSRSSLLLMVGVQTQSTRVGFFIQDTLFPGGRDFLVTSSMNLLEIGVRHSFGSPSESSR